MRRMGWPSSDKLRQGSNELRTLSQLRSNLVGCARRSWSTAKGRCLSLIWLIRDAPWASVGLCHSPWMEALIVRFVTTRPKFWA
jgi:hypothetical protein